MEGIKLKIFLFLEIFSLYNSELSPDQAMQLASKMKACMPVNPGGNLGNYRDKVLGQWEVVKIYDAPMEESHPIPTFKIAKQPVTGHITLECESRKVQNTR